MLKPSVSVSCFEKLNSLSKTTSSELSARSWRLTSPPSSLKKLIHWKSTKDKELHFYVIFSIQAPVTTAKTSCSFQNINISLFPYIVRKEFITCFKVMKRKQPLEMLSINSLKFVSTTEIL